MTEAAALGDGTLSKLAKLVAIDTRRLRRGSGSGCNVSTPRRRRRRRRRRRASGSAWRGTTRRCEAVTLCDRGCHPRLWRLQPCVALRDGARCSSRRRSLLRMITDTVPALFSYGHSLDYIWSQPLLHAGDSLCCIGVTASLKYGYRRARSSRSCCMSTSGASSGWRSGRRSRRSGG